MRKTLATIGIATACLLGPTAAAHAATGHQSCPTHCTPAPKPPKGGWPCQATHTCKPPKHPHCPPKKHHHRHPKPPVVTPPSSAPIPPVKTAPKPHHVPAARVRLVADVTPTQVPAELAFTGIDLRDALLTAGGLTGAGCLLVLSTFTAPMRRFTRQAGTR